MCHSKQAGKEKEFENVYNQYFLKIYHYIRRHTLNDQDAEDLASDVFLSVYRHFDSFDPTKAKMSTWIFVIAKNRLKNYYRANQSKDEVDGEEVIAWLSDEHDWDEALRLEEQRHAITRLLESLPEIDQQIVILSYFHDKTSQEVAQELGISAINVRVRLSRALKKMKKTASEHIEFSNLLY